VHSGDKATLLFTFYRKHDAGFMQTLDVNAGEVLTLNAFAHAWSNHPIPGHATCADNPRCSCGVGKQSYFALTENIETSTGNAWRDAISNFEFILGIDPYGGTNPFSERVVWGKSASIYNTYHRVPGVTVKAKSEQITVFLRSRTAWKFKHNDAYWDSVSLQVQKSETDCIAPREQYSRTYVLLPQNADMQTRIASTICTSRQKYTVGHSADDAGVGPLDRKVIAVNAQEWPGDLEAFFKRHYPGLEYSALEAQTPYELAVMLRADLETEEISLAQDAGAWEAYDFGEAHGGTIKQYGCLLTSLAMLIRDAHSKDILPPELDQVLRLAQSIYSGDNIVNWRVLPDIFPTLFKASKKVNRTYSASELQKLMNSDWYIVLARKDFKHFVYLKEVREGKLVIIDPWGAQEKIVEATWAGGIRALKTTCEPEQPEPDPPEPDPEEPPAPALTGRTASVHTQMHTALSYIQEHKPSVYKLVLGMERARDIKARSPDTKVVYRHYVSDQGQFWNSPEDGARKYLETFLDSLHTNSEYIDYVESLNETIATGDTQGIKRTVQFDVNFAEALEEEGLPAKPALLTAAVGNPGHNEVQLLIPAARKAYALDGVLAYHNYWGARPGYTTLDDAWKHYAGRALESWDPVFRNAGIYPKYIFTESGAVSIAPGGHMNAQAGWKHSSCLRGDADKYIEQIHLVEKRIAAWNAEHSNRCLGFTLFTLGGGKDWKYFEVGEILERL
jgi:hypothetical protein